MCVNPDEGVTVDIDVFVNVHYPAPVINYLFSLFAFPTLVFCWN